ncbi:MAG TPA: SprT family zinc-dependent metalloprotease [Syntrophales bacterium]|nr:SprT family zinc-dependent metalloprotease [Syntrophales bacterium]
MDARPLSDYTLVRSPRRWKTISLQVLPDGTVLVQAPRHTPKREIEDFFWKKQPWLARKRREQAARRPHARRIAAGETFPYLGVPYPLEIVPPSERTEPLVFTGTKFVLHETAVRGGKALFIRWYRRQAMTYLTGRVAVFSLRLGVLPRGIRIGQARHRWGSCSPENRLSFPWRLIMAPPDVIDYVVVHELAHIREKSHAPAFWALVDCATPRHREHRRWLKDHDHLLSL